MRRWYGNGTGQEKFTPQGHRVSRLTSFVLRITGVAKGPVTTIRLVSLQYGLLWGTIYIVYKEVSKSTEPEQYLSLQHEFFREIDMK